jgi:hypothetical protein
MQLGLGWTSLAILPPKRGGGRPGPFAAELEVIGIQGPLAADEPAVRPTEDSRYHPIREQRCRLPHPRREVRVAPGELWAEPCFSVA